MAVGKNPGKKGGRKSAKKKIQDPMMRKEWYDVVAPSNFKNRQFTKTICNKTVGIKVAADYLRGRVYEGNLADLEEKGGKDQPYTKIKFMVDEVQGRNLLTSFHGLVMTNDKLRSMLRKWCTTIENVIEARRADGYTLRIFMVCFTARQKNQLSKNCYAKTRLVKWLRHRMTTLTQKRIARLNINQAVTQIKDDILTDLLFKRCNPIIPIRDVKIIKIKTIRRPRVDAQRIADAHGTDVPVSHEADERIVQVVEVAEEEKKPAEKEGEKKPAAEKEGEKKEKPVAEKEGEKKPAEKKEKPAEEKKPAPEKAEKAEKKEEKKPAAEKAEKKEEKKPAAEKKEEKKAPKKE